MTILRSHLLSGIVILVLAMPAAAQTDYTWTGAGADGNWSTSANWGGTVPVSSLIDTRIVLAGTTNTSTTIDASYGATLQIRGLTFQNNSGPFTVASAGSVLEIGADGIVASGGTATQTISAPIRLGANQTWSLAGTNGRLVATGSVDLGSRTLTFGATNASWFVELTGQVSGTGRLVVRGRTVLQSANTYSGGTLIDGGYGLQIASAASLGTGLVELKANSTLTVTAAGDSTIVGGLAISNVQTTDINRLQVNHESAIIRLPAGGLTGSGKFSREGAGSLILTGANPYSGTFFGGFYGRTELIDSGGGASMNASSYSIFESTFRIGPGALLLGTRGILADQNGRIEIEQSQTLSGVSLGQSGANPPQSFPNTAILAPNVDLTLTNGIYGSHGTLIANMHGHLTGGFLKAGDGTMILSGTSTFTGQTTINAGVLSIDTIANAGSPSAIGAGDALSLGARGTLRYTGATASTNRPITMSSSVAAPAGIEVANAATVLTWNAAIDVGTNEGFVKSGPGTLVLTAQANVSGGTTTVTGGTLTVTGIGGLSTATTVKSGATLSGGRTSNPALNISSATIEAGGTLRAGTGLSTDLFGIGSVRINSGSTFVVTVDGGASPRSSRISTGSSGSSVANFVTSTSNPITLRLEKGTGDAFEPGVPVTLVIVRGNEFGGFSNNLIQRNFGTFVYVPNEWTIQTVGFEIVPGSASLITDANQRVLSVQFTPVPEPWSVLGIACAGGLALAAIRRRFMLKRTSPLPIPRALSPGVAVFAKSGTKEGQSGLERKEERRASHPRCPAPGASRRSREPISGACAAG